MVLFIMLYKVVLSFESVHGWNPIVLALKCKLLSSNFPVMHFIMPYKVVLTFESAVYEIP